MDGYLVTKSEIDAMEGTAKEHFLNSNAQRALQLTADSAAQSRLVAFPDSTTPTVGTSREMRGSARSTET